MPRIDLTLDGKIQDITYGAVENFGSRTRPLEALVKDAAAQAGLTIESEMTTINPGSRLSSPARKYFDVAESSDLAGQLSRFRQKLADATGVVVGTVVDGFNNLQSAHLTAEPKALNVPRDVQLRVEIGRDDVAHLGELIKANLNQHSLVNVTGYDRDEVESGVKPRLVISFKTDSPDAVVRQATQFAADVTQKPVSFHISAVQGRGAISEEREPSGTRPTLFAQPAVALSAAPQKQ